MSESKKWLQSVDQLKVKIKYVKYKCSKKLLIML